MIALKLTKVGERWRVIVNWDNVLYIHERHPNGSTVHLREGAVIEVLESPEDINKILLCYWGVRK